jgi:hypothetical protein
MDDQVRRLIGRVDLEGERQESQEQVDKDDKTFRATR